MKKINYSLRLSGLNGKAAFTEATREELRVLLSLVALDGSCESENELASYAGVSVSRCRAALVFWETEGFILKKDGEGIVHEFEERLMRGEIDDEPAKKVAEHIRDENLSSMLDECATLMGQACLSNTEIKNITALVSQYGLSPEFIATLAAHLASKNALTVRRLCNKAIDLQKNDCDNLDSLEEYIKNLENGYEWEYRKVLGIYGRSLSKSEKEYFKKWSASFGYSSAIISLAYDVAVLNTKDGRGDLRYMDAILTHWSETGCKTLNDCQARLDGDRQAQKRSAPVTERSSKSKPQTPRYGDFDINDAFKKALERSYGEADED